MAAMVSDTPTPQEMSTSAKNAQNSLSVFPIVEIKSEPDVEIIDTPTTRGSSDESYDDKIFNDSPKIRLTPTIKLLATPNPINPKRKFACPYENCTKSYGKSSHLRSHLTWHTGIKPFVCQEPNCGKGFTRSDELNRHIRTHTGEKPFECVQCTKKFSRSDHLTKHLATHAKQRIRNQLNNEQQQQQTTTSNDNPESKRSRLEIKSTNNDNNSFQQEGKHFLTDCVESTKEEPEDLTDEPHFGHTPIKIKLEKPEFSNEYQIVKNNDKTKQIKRRQQQQQQQQQQLQTRIGSNSDIEDEIPHMVITPELSSMVYPPSPSDDVKPEMNDDAIMPEANALPLPTTAHGHDVAGIGGGVYNSISNYGNYAQDEKRPFICVQCGKSFKRQDDLNRHSRTHSGEKPYACAECEKRFVRSDHLKNHMKTHTKVR